MPKILPIFIDTNVLLHHFEYKLNIEDAIERIISKKFEIYVHPMVEAEIIDALTKKGKIARQAKVAMQLISRYYGYKDKKGYHGADIALIKSAEREGGCVLTFDKDLKHRCKAQNIPVISVYRQGRLALTGEIG
ncbi:MAG: PIN domain-containing protein [Candidatus Kariarchaeaceae archaeon]|jgi:rRNA-processing protein FCF1